MVSARYADKVLKVKGIEEADRILKEFVNGLDKLTAKNFQELSKNIIEAANARTPIDTGRLVSNNKVLKSDSKHLVIGNPTPYARHVHDGTSRMPARPFFRAPIETATRKFPNLIVKDCSEFYQELVRKNKPT